MLNLGYIWWCYEKSKIDEILKTGFNIIILSSIIFLIYIGFISKTTVSERRIVHKVSEYNDLTMTIVNNDTSPTKIKKVYQGTINNHTNLDDCLVLYKQKEEYYKTHNRRRKWFLLFS